MQKFKDETWLITILDVVVRNDEKDKIKTFFMINLAVTADLNYKVVFGLLRLKC